MMEKYQAALSAHIDGSGDEQVRAVPHRPVWEAVNIRMGMAALLCVCAMIRQCALYRARETQG
jgi:hypothetical protein